MVYVIFSIFKYADMSHADIAIQFNESFKRCVNDPYFIDNFYDIFLSSSDEVKLIFRNTDIETQKVMLITSMAYMTDAYSNKPNLLADIAEKHNKSNLDIKPHLYTLWLDSLIAAAKSIDPLFNSHTEQLWRTVLQPGIDYMVSKHH